MSLKGSHRSRLRQIEKSIKTRSLGDHLVVIEANDQPGVFRGKGRDGVERVWSEEELDAYPGQVVKVVFTRIDAPIREG